jgi:hypothetical protein
MIVNKRQRLAAGDVGVVAGEAADADLVAGQSPAALFRSMPAAYRNRLPGTERLLSLLVAGA